MDDTAAISSMVSDRGLLASSISTSSSCEEEDEEDEPAGKFGFSSTSSNGSNCPASPHAISGNSSIKKELRPFLRSARLCVNHPHCNNISRKNGNIKQATANMRPSTVLLLLVFARAWAS